ncbi:MAG TPA: hypothetical protein VKQ52_22165, partial [Puia sp.]|nr:hypothetical protein [Puia sp.]
LFPLPLITDQDHALLISKSNPLSPNLADLSGSAFSGQLRDWLEKAGTVSFYNIGNELSPYWKALKETGVFRFEQGDLYTLQSHLHHNTFLTHNQRTDQVVIEPAGIIIRRNDEPGDTSAIGTTATPSNNPQPVIAKYITTPELSAPDHLLRLFAYRRIMQELKGRLPGSYRDDDLDANTPQVQMAQEAGIVSPVSSLVVLEKQSDYDKFNIRQSRNSLENASLHDKGAVPEPGEWAILVTILGLLTFIRYHRLRRRSTTSQ